MPSLRSFELKLIAFAFAFAIPGGSEEDNVGHSLRETSSRLILRLLVKYLRTASLTNAEACANNALHLLPMLIDPSKPASRQVTTPVYMTQCHTDKVVNSATIWDSTCQVCHHLQHT